MKPPSLARDRRYGPCPDPDRLLRWIRRRVGRSVRVELGHDEYDVDAIADACRNTDCRAFDPCCEDGAYCGRADQGAPRADRFMAGRRCGMGCLLCCSSLSPR
jgi:hypothetical protein